MDSCRSMFNHTLVRLFWHADQALQAPRFLADVLALAADALAAPGGEDLGSALLAALVAADAAAFMAAALAVALAAPGGRGAGQNPDHLPGTGVGLETGGGGGGGGGGGRGGPGEGGGPGGSRGAALSALLALVQAVELPLPVAMDALVQVCHLLSACFCQALPHVTSRFRCEAVASYAGGVKAETDVCAGPQLPAGMQNPHREKQHAARVERAGDRCPKQRGADAPRHTLRPDAHAAALARHHGRAA